jgi:glycerophosphoryl diester phosphodiesterase
MVESGRDVHVWTVNSEEELALCRSLGVRAVITDRPKAVLGWLDAVRTA